MSTVFLSHVTEEGPLAVVLKRWLEASFSGQCKVFVSSSANDLPAGKKWLEEIDGALSSATVMLVLCSTMSVKRPWINFEAGCAWIKRIPVIPVCHSGQEVGALPVPLGSFQALSTGQPDFSVLLLTALVQHLGFSQTPPISHTDMTREIAQAERDILALTISRRVQISPSTDEGALIMTAVSSTDDLAVGEFACRVTEREDQWWKYSWKVKVTNHGTVKMGFYIRVDFQDSEGFSLEHDLATYDGQLGVGHSLDISRYRTLKITHAEQVARVAAVISPLRVG